MTQLDILRENLGQCDEIILDALLMRNRIVEDIMSYKESNDLPILQPEQEAKQRKWLEGRLEGKRHVNEVRSVFQSINKNSKRIQARKLFHYNLVLIGFMGVGKTTMSDYFNTMFAMDVIEMDQIIARREGMSIPDIFEIHGEEYFRNCETELLIEMQMKKNGRVILLTAEPETILERVRDDHSRPLLENNKNVSFIRELMDKRREKYEAAADIIIRTDGRSIQEIGEEIIVQLRVMDGLRD